MDAGIPTAQTMVRKIYEDEWYPDQRRALDVAIAGLKFRKGVAEGDPFAEIDVEDLYTTLQLLAERHTHHLAPFVGSWGHSVQVAEQPDTSAGAREVTRELSRLLDQGPRASLTTFSFESALAKALTGAAAASSEVFARAAERTQDVLVSLCHVTDQKKVTYLKPMLRSAQAGVPLWIASLNYDNAVELAAEGLQVAVDRGIERRPVTLSEVAPIKLAKLHGSADWEGSKSGIKISAGPARYPLLIFGAGNKLTVDGPFLDLLFLFRDRLATTDELVACGYSFRDPHVNHLIDTWLASARHRRLVVIDPHLDQREVANRLRPYTYFDDPDPVKARVTVHQKTMSQWVQSEFGADAA